MHELKSIQLSESELAACVRKVLRQYLSDLDGEPATAIHEMVISTVEKPLIEEVLLFNRNNQTRAALMLGINRNTLKKRMTDLRIED